MDKARQPIPPFLPVSAAIRPRIDAYWAALFGEQWAHPPRKRPRIVYSARSPGFFGLQTSGPWSFAVAPAVSYQAAQRWVRRVLPLLALQRAGQRYWPWATRQLWPQLAAWSMGGRLLSPWDHELYGPAYLLYCTQMALPLDDRVAIHALADLPPAMVAQFQQAMGTVAWQMNQPQWWPRLLGILQGEQVVAVGAVRLWEERIGEIFVDTLPSYRGRGYAKRLTAYLTDWMLRETPWLPQYDAEISNLPSLRVAYAVGYRYYGTMLLGSRSQGESE
ncbi:MAG: GNAT family N-acetyltransferase [Caldilineaceae bacterium]|nr:GNAT family N-acetyltransferase [Caldilineaceae bacterium]